jgi:hypothetical protein
MSDHDSPRVPGASEASEEEPDGEADARSRLAPVRSAALAGGASIPDAVWEDATQQLAGMLRALATLQREVPALDDVRGPTSNVLRRASEASDLGPSTLDPGPGIVPPLAGEPGQEAGG